MRVVLVGGSGHGFHHLQAWRKHPGVASLTVVGRDASRLDAMAGEFGVSVSTDLAAAAAQADLVDICTPTDTHSFLARISLEAGVPTIVEKPPCRTVAEAEALAAVNPDVPLYCVLNYRFSPVWLRVRELIAWGSIGRPKLALWPVLADNRQLMVGDQFRADAARSGGALLDGAFHLIDLMPWVIGQPLRAVTAVMRRLAVKAPAGEDTALAVFEHDDCLSQLTYSWAVPNPTRLPAATLIGDEATLLVPRSAKQPIELVRNRESSEVDLGKHKVLPRNDLANCLYHFVDCARGVGPCSARWSDGVAAQRVVETTTRAAEEGRRLELP
jgi:predicted dehydrogenase